MEEEEELETTMQQKYEVKVSLNDKNLSSIFDVNLRQPFSYGTGKQLRQWTLNPTKMWIWDSSKTVIHL